MMVYLELAFEFVKTGLFSIGGGLATIPFLKEMAESKPWFDMKQLTDMIAISESTPGAMGVNMATYAGFNAGGILGSVVATLALIFPSIVCICIISLFLEKFRSNKLVDYAFYGIRPASTAMIIASMTDVFLGCMFNSNPFSLGAAWFQAMNWIGMGLFVVILLGSIFLKKVHPIFFIAFGALAGIVFQL